MNAEKLKERIAEIEKALADTVTNHAALMVRLDESKYILAEMEKMEPSPCEQPVAEECISS